MGGRKEELFSKVVALSFALPLISLSFIRFFSIPTLFIALPLYCFLPFASSSSHFFFFFFSSVCYFDLCVHRFIFAVTDVSSQTQLTSDLLLYTSLLCLVLCLFARSLVSFLLLFYFCLFILWVLLFSPVFFFFFFTSSFVLRPFSFFSLFVSLFSVSVSLLSFRFSFLTFLWSI